MHRQSKIRYSPTWPVYAGYLNGSHVGEWCKIRGEIGIIMGIKYDTKHAATTIRFRKATRETIHLRLDPRELIQSSP